MRELQLKLQSTEMLLRQAKLKSEAEEQKIDQLTTVLMHKGTEGTKDDQMISLLRREVRSLEQKLALEKQVNEDNREEMRRLERDIEMLGQAGTNTECILQNRLDEQFMLRRQDKLELQKAQGEIIRLQNLLQEQKIMLRQEQNNTKIMEMENQAMLRHTAQERQNLYKLQQIKALTVSSQAFVTSPKGLHCLDLERKSKSLTKTLLQTKRMH